MSLFQLTKYHEWDHFLLSKVPLVIESTSCHPDYLFLLRGGGAGGQLAQILGKVCAPAEPKSRPMTRAKFFIEKPGQSFLDFTYFYP